MPRWHTIAHNIVSVNTPITHSPTFCPICTTWYCVVENPYYRALISQCNGRNDVFTEFCVSLSNKSPDDAVDQPQPPDRHEIHSQSLLLFICYTFQDFHISIASSRDIWISYTKESEAIIAGLEAKRNEWNIFLIQTSNVLGPTFREQVQEWSVHQSEGYARWPQGWGMLTHPDVIGLSCGFVEMGKGSRRREGRGWGWGVVWL